MSILEGDRITTIRVKTSTLERIKGYGKYGDTMEDILLKLLRKLEGEE